jgi:hypothetical protein
MTVRIGGMRVAVLRVERIIENAAATGGEDRRGSYDQGNRDLTAHRS